MWKFDSEACCAIVGATVGEFSTATQADGWVLGVGTQGGERELADGSEILGGMTFANAAVVLAVSDIKNPVHGFNAAMDGGGVRELLDRLDAGADDKGAPLYAHLALDVLLGLDQTGAAQGFSAPSIDESIHDTSRAKTARCRVRRYKPLR